MLQIEIPFSLTIEAPFISQASEPGSYGLDAVLVRDQESHRPMITASLLVGHLRQAWEELASALGQEENECVPKAPDIDTLLGKGSSKGDLQPETRRLFFTDCYLDPEEKTENNNFSPVRCRISMDRERGVAEDSMIQLVDSPFLSGSPLVFNGKVRFETNDSDKAKIIREQILCGMQWMDQIGGFASIGFGRVLDVQVGEIQEHPIIIPEACENDSEFSLSLEPEAPFCIAGRPQADNIFVSEEVIPGGVIKGALYRAIKNYTGSCCPEKDENLGLLAKNFSKIRITHAFPSTDKTKRPTAFPFSLVAIEKDFFDVALQEKPGLINGKAPAFCVDWKPDQEAKARDCFGWPNLKREMRVRNAMDREKLRTEDEKLFAYEMIRPQGHSWLAKVDLSAIKDPRERSEVCRQLKAVLTPGLLGIGKSKTAAKVHFPPMFNGAGEHLDVVDGNPLVLTLQTPALLLDYRKLLETPDPHILHKVYQESWKKLCEGLCLKHFFARQFLSGGLYQKSRFQKDKYYYPWLLTEAGSVFVFTVTDQSLAKEAISNWQSSGLSLPASVLDAYGIPETREEQWQYCPFIPENGFGEIAVNLAVHWEKQPKENQYEPIEAPDTSTKEDCHV